MGGSAISSGLLTTSTVIYTGLRYFVGAIVLTDGTNAATVTVYDTPNTSGAVVCKLSCAGPDRESTFSLGDGGVRAKRGLYALVEGTNAGAIVYHK